MKTWPILSGQLHLATTHLGEGPDQVLGGACDPDPEGARQRASAEALERRALLNEGPRLIRSREEVLSRGAVLLWPDPSLEVEHSWLLGERRDDGRLAAVPALTSLLGWSDGRSHPWKQSSVGTAAHPRRAQALRSALLECVERHAVRAVWNGTARLHPLAANRFLPDGLEPALTAAHLQVRGWRIATKLPAAVALVAVIRDDIEQITFGAAARAPDDFGAAVRHATYEAISVRAALANPRSPAEELAVPRQMATRQSAFLAHLATMEAPSRNDAPSASKAGLCGAIRAQFGTCPVAVDLPAGRRRSVVRVVIPHAEFLLHRESQDHYVMSPGYIE